MNIFFCDQDPGLAAYSLPDVLVRKMCVESAQLLCSLAHRRGLKDIPYKIIPQGADLVDWMDRDPENLRWFIDHFAGLICSYHSRYQSFHDSIKVLHWWDRLHSFQESHYATWKAPVRKPTWWDINQPTESYIV